jgi:shikimate dehydrogenase
VRILAAVLGRPIEHSKSPLLHRAAFTALGLSDSEYTRAELGADELEDFLDSHPEHTGFSLTMPLKDRLVALAGERGWTVDDTAALTGAGNTLVRFPDRVEVANTDVRGIVRAIAPHLGADAGAPFAGASTRSVAGGSAGAGSAGAGRATILGAGATAASALVACRELGIDHVDFLVRNPDRAERVLALADRLGITAATAPLETIAVSSIVISTLPAEAAPALVWDSSFTAGEVPGAVALDVAYAAKSSFLAAAAEHGLHPVAGTAMLVEQAVAQSEMFIAAAAEGASAPNLPCGDELRERIVAAMYAALEDPSTASRD